MSKRKTIAVEDVISFVNDMLRDSDNDRVAARIGAYLVLEEILHRTGNYNGFRYLTKQDVRSDYTVGVNYEVNQHGALVPCEDYNKRFENTDESRRRYH